MPSFRWWIVASSLAVLVVAGQVRAAARDGSAPSVADGGANPGGRPQSAGVSPAKDGGVDRPSGVATAEMRRAWPCDSKPRPSTGALWTVVVVVSVMLTLTIIGFVVRHRREAADEPDTTFWSLCALAASIILWAVAGQAQWERTVLLVWLSLASFMVGCLVGFLFSSFGEEVNSFGKVREWLVGAITAFTFAKANGIASALAYFAGTPDQCGIGWPTTIAAVVLYVGLGFLFMFFQRELILNVLLARSRAERGRVEGTVKAGQVAQNFLVSVPTSILTGIDDIDDSGRITKEEADRLRGLLFSDEVNGFLEKAEQSAKAGTAEWDVTSKAANLHYYRIYFEKDGAKRVQATRAYEWIQRALTVNPLHADLTVKQADVFGTLGRYAEAVALLEGLVRRPDAPAFVKQWLGYMYLFVDRLADAVRFSEEYLAAFPEDPDSRINLACAHAQRYCELKTKDEGETPAAKEARDKALAWLKDALRREPSYAEIVRTKWTQPGESFDCLRGDREFSAIVGPAPPA